MIATFHRRFADLLTRIVERSAAREKLEMEQRADFAEVERIMGCTAGRAIITVLTEARRTCTGCGQTDVAESEMASGLCVECAVKRQEQAFQD